MKPYPVSVKWVDSSVSYGWCRVEELRHWPMAIFSIGWLVKKSKKSITITTSLDPYGKVTEPFTIPRCAITKMKRIKI